MTASIMEEIKRAEHEAEQIIQSAEKKKGEIIQDTKKDSAAFLARKEQETLISVEKMLADAREKTEIMKRKIMEDGRLSIKGLERKAAARKEKAAELAIRAFEEEINDA